MCGLQRTQRRWGFALLASALLAFAGPARAEDKDDTGPILAASRKAVADGEITQSRVLGFNLGPGAFSEAPDNGGVLIGFDIGLGKPGATELVYAIRAVYLTPTGEAPLQDHGLWRSKALPKRMLKTHVTRTEHLRARPGYAVGGLAMHSGLQINGLSVTFMRIHGKTLDPNDAYQSDWVGDRTGGGEDAVGGDGAPAVGILGMQDEEKICALGLIFISEPPPAQAAPILPALPVPPARPRVSRPAVPPVQDPPVLPPIDFPLAPPAPPMADAPADPAQQAAEPASVAPQTTAAPALVQSALLTLLSYALPVVAFVAVAGVIGTVAVCLRGRKSPPPARREASRPGRAARRPAAAAKSSTTAICDIPTVIPVSNAPQGDGEVLELTAEHFDPEPATVPHNAPQSSGDWPRLEL